MSEASLPMDAPNEEDVPALKYRFDSLSQEDIEAIFRHARNAGHYSHTPSRVFCISQYAHERNWNINMKECYNISYLMSLCKR